MNTNTVNQHSKMKEAHIVEIGGKLLHQIPKIPKKYMTNSNNTITAKDKESNSNIIWIIIYILYFTMS